MRIPNLLVTVLFAVSAQAETFVVTNLDDGGDGSLRDAVLQANETPASDFITFSEGLNGTLTVASTLTVTAPLEIQGPGSDQIRIDGGNTVRVFLLSGSSDLAPHRFRDLTIQNGRTNLGGANIRVTGSLDLINCSLLGGQAIALSGAGNNLENADGGGLFHSTGNLLIEDSLIEGNSTVGGFSQGGGFYTERGTATIRRTRIVGNTTNGSVAEGGGLGSRSTMVLENCEISGNETLARSSGGGGVYCDSPITLRQCTISGNTVGATPGTGVSGYSVGGAFANVGSSPATFESCTITANSAPRGVGQGPGISSLSRGVLSFRHCIVAGNIGAGDLDETPNGRVNYRDDGFNVFGDVANTILDSSANQDSTSRYGITDLELSALAFHGGLTQSHLPLPGSLALDTGSLSRANLPDFDQRGGDFPRFVGTRLDIGATERQSFFDADSDGIPDAVELLVTGLAGSGGDLDGDGVSDADEYALLGIAAISNATLRPALRITPNLANPDAWNLAFPHSPNREYRLLFNADLVSPLSPVGTDYVQFPTNALAQITAPGAGSQGFFFLESRIPEEATE